MANASKDFLWLTTARQNNHSFMRKGIRKTFSTDPLNPKGIENLRYTGNVQRKALSVVPHQSGKGVTLVYKKTHSTNKPAKAVEKVPLTKNSRRTLQVIRKFCNRNRYRFDLKTIALRRASAILRSQKSRPKGRGAAKST